MNETEKLKQLRLSVSLYLKRIRELEQQLSKTTQERDLALRSADKYRQRMRGWQDGALESADAFVCRTEQLEQENAKLKDQNAELEARARQHKIWYENELVLKEKLKQEIARLISANEGWHLRVRELKTESEAWEQENAKLRDRIARLEAALREIELRRKEACEILEDSE